MGKEIGKNRSITFHLLFWSVLWILYVFFFSYNSQDFTVVFLFSTSLIPITAIPTCLTVYFLIPKYLRQKRYVWFCIHSVSTFLFTTLCVILLLVFTIAYIEHTKFHDLPVMGRNYAYLIILIYLVVAIVSFASVWRGNVHIEAQKEELQKQLLTIRLKAKEQELTNLKNQIHPHFLFNTLNTIYGLALKKSSETPEVILKLSKLLDYVLYQTDKNQVPLNEEIMYLEQYIDLESIRFNDTLKLNFNKDIKENKMLIAPLLLLPLVENIFKHGSIIDGFLTAEIYISLIEGQLLLSTENTFKPSNNEEGLGIRNIKDRLLILYPENHDLIIESDSNQFRVVLKVNLLNSEKDV